MDVNMPVMKGDEACRLITSQGHCSSVILMSAENEVLARTYKDYGASAFMAKPLDRDSLVRLIELLTGKTLPQSDSDEATEQES